jgi:hypothetical protein
MYVLIIGIGVALAILAGLLYYSNKSQKSQIYVYPKTKNQYLVKGIVKMKDINSGEWTDAVLYVSMKNRHHYVREKRQFLKQFITLKEWEKQDGNSK